MGCNTELWKNTSNVSTNEAPGIPQNLKANLVDGTNMLSLSWDAATDDVTPQSALQYNIYLKKKDSETCYMTVPADISSGFIKVGRISGQLTQCSYKIKIESNGEYEWGVQAIDNGKKGSLFAKSTLTIDKVSGITHQEEEATIFIHSKEMSVYYSIQGMGDMTVFNIDGSIVYQSQVQESGSVTLQEKGTYIVMIKTNTTIKRQKCIIL